MKSGYGLSSNGSPEPARGHRDLASRHVPGLSDAIGDRVLILDDRSEPSLELLRFAPTLTTTPGFEVALRRRVERLRQFRDPAFATTPAVECLGEDRTLVLLSSWIPGKRLSELVDSAQGPAFAASLIQQLAPALATLYHYGEGVGHGALTANRIVISSEGHPVIVEHVLGSALERLQLSAHRMYVDLGIPVPPTAGTAYLRMDSRTDAFQLGLIALSLLLGRTVGPDEYSANFHHTLDEAFTESDRESAEQFPWLRGWLERALQVSGRSFPSAAVSDAVRDIPDRLPESITQRWKDMLEIRRVTAAHPVELRVELPQPPHEEALLETEPSEPHPETPPPVVPYLNGLSTSSEDVHPDDVAPVVATTLAEGFASTDSPAILDPPAIFPQHPLEAFEEVKEPILDQPRIWSAPQPKVQSLPASRKTRRSSLLKWAIAALAFCALAEAVIIAMLAQRRWNAPAPAPVVKIAEVSLETPNPGATVMVDGRSAGVTPLQLQIGPDVRSISVVTPESALKQESMVGSTGLQNTQAGSRRDPAAEAGARAPNTLSAVSAPQRVGGIRFSSPIDLEVFEGDKRLGSSATGIVTAPAGRRELELVNSALGYRSRQAVDIRGGTVISLVVSPPNGRININAVPWAEVLIDGKSVGETPIGNLSIPLGEHEIIFRHPQLGEQRRTVIVRSDAVARISANLER
jgi:hypothetical protein